jgi:hypothetical protein
MHADKLTRWPLGWPLGWSFDLLRAQRAAAVQAGLVPNSLLASRDFEHTLGALERLTLGAWARSV